MDGNLTQHTSRTAFPRWRERMFSSLASLVLLACAAATGQAKDPEWIWLSDTRAEEAIRVGETCFFRKPINLRVAAEARIEIAADDQYDLYINGQRIASGKAARTLDQYEIGDYFQVGRNMVAIRVKNAQGDTAALAAMISVRPTNSEKWFEFPSNSSWKTTPQWTQGWEAVAFDDRSWLPASSFGPLESAEPEQVTPDLAQAPPTKGSAAKAKGNSTPTSAADPDEPANMETASDAVANVPAPTSSAGQRERFQIQKGFGIQRVLGDDKTGSIIAMTFNEFGHLILSQENGSLLLAYDDDDDGVPETVRTYCDKVKSCQGILALNGAVFVTGQGPDGHALYKLSDIDRNGSLEKIETILKFVDWSGRPAKPGEHGAHGLRLGYDGMLYVTLGSHVQVKGKTGEGQTYRDPYEGDLLPRYEDPSGHGQGVKAPGGTIIRTNTAGTVVERVAGGLRNAYDLVFHPSGALFVHDADMEADIDTPWYRPNAVFDVTEGGEFGWRTGWAKWPSYYYDRLPDLLDTGRGSPTGATCYEHYSFPVRYQDTLFLADWSEGRILNVRIERNGASFTADSEVFLQGQPLNVTDLEVGKDGALYFCTGGRSTSGGVYRVIYKGKVPERVKKLGTGIAAAIRQPQIGSAWSRQEIASIKRELGDQWNQLVAGVAYSEDNPEDYRVRAMTLMQLFGPIPSEELLLELSDADSALVRAKAAVMLGRSSGDRSGQRLTELLNDSEAAVQRAAAESMLRANLMPESMEPLLELLASSDRTLAFVGRRLLERMPADTFRDEVLETANSRIAIVGMLALISAESSEETAIEVLERSSEMMAGFLSDADFIDLLRLCQVALHRSGLDPQRVAALGEQIAEEFPAGEQRINHEVIRLATYLQADSLADRAIDYIQSDASHDSRTLVAMCLQAMSNGWSAQQRFALLKFFEKTANRSTSGSLPMYMTNVTRDFAATLSEDDRQAILEQGHIWRNAALAAIYKLQRPIDAKTTQTLMSLDEKLQSQDDGKDVLRRLRTGIIAMLASSEETDAADYLRKLWRDEPGRRDVLSMALSTHPEGDNWDYLVRSLNFVDTDAAEEVVRALVKVPVATDDPAALRHLILQGVRAESEQRSFEHVEELLEHWTGMERPKGEAETMRPWQKWYAKVYPDRPPAVLPEADQSRWDFDELVSYLGSDKGRFGDAVRGKLAFNKAQCAQCHRFGSYGESIGPT